MMKGNRVKDLIFVFCITALGILAACSNSDDDTTDEDEAQRIADSIAQSAIDNAAIDAYVESKGLSNLIVGESGIRYGVLSAGNGTFAEINDIVSINYIGRFLNDSVFDTSIEQVALLYDVFNPNGLYQPITFNHTVDGGGIGTAFLPQFRVGLGELVPMMDLGATAILLMPSATAYGETGDVFDPNAEDVIPPNTVILFEFSLVNLRN